MINISVPKSQVSATQIIALHQFEASFIENLKFLLAKTQYKHLKVLPTFELKSREEEPARIVHNASFALQNSLKLVDDITAFVKKYDEIGVILPSQTLLIKLQIEKNENAKNASEKQGTQADSNPNDSLPTFTPVKPRYDFSEVVLPQEVINRIMADLAVIQKQDLIYNQWGFKEIDKVPRSVLNFYGKPGTGKTMCAHAIASEVNKPLLALNYSEIESKYVGDAPKNLKHAFDTAKELDAVLFFDEADSFLGKRIQNVTQGAEQALNSLRSQMLILLEEFEGIVIFATNLVSNFDKAFESRILDSIEIPLPDREGRAKLLKKMTPSKLPLERVITDDEFLEISDIIDGLAGREIKNALLKMLLNKADNPDHCFTVDDYKEAMTAKMDELAALRAEENRILEEKILKALKEKGAMEKAEQEAKTEQEPKAVQETDSNQSSESADIS